MVSYGLGVPIIAQTDVAQMTQLELMAWAFGVSLAGGIASALRKRKVTATDIVKVGVNTGVMGLSLALIASNFTDDPNSNWLIIGVCGILSLGGISTVDWVEETIRNKVGKRIDGQKQ